MAQKIKKPMQLSDLIATLEALQEKVGNPFLYGPDGKVVVDATVVVDPKFTNTATITLVENS